VYHYEHALDEPRAREWHVHMHGVGVGLGLSASTVRHLPQFPAFTRSCARLAWRGIASSDNVAEVCLALWFYQQSTACKTQEHRQTTPPIQGIWASDQHAGHRQTVQTDGTKRWHTQMALAVSTDRQYPTCANSSTSSKSPGEQSAGTAIWQGRAVGHTAFCPWGLCSMQDWATCSAREHIHITYLIDEQTVKQTKARQILPQEPIFPWFPWLLVKIALPK